MTRVWCTLSAECALVPSPQKCGATQPSSLLTAYGSKAAPDFDLFAQPAFSVLTSHVFQEALFGWAPG